MATINPNTTVGELVAQQPGRSRVFERLGIDYCCGGKKTLAKACEDKSLDPQTVVDQLVKEDTQTPDTGKTAAQMTMTELADHIEQTHHKFLGEELPRIGMLLQKIANAHGGSNPRLLQLQEVFTRMWPELEQHMMKEEQILFPMIRELEVCKSLPSFHCGSLANPINMMEMEHDSAGAAIAAMHELTDGFTPPADACGTYRAGMEALARFEADMHQHVHKENNILFPRALKRQQELASTSKSGAK